MRERCGRRTSNDPRSFPWEATIRHLLEQVAIGAADPVRSIPLHLRRPRPVSTPPGPGSTGTTAPGPRPRHAASEQGPSAPPPVAPPRAEPPPAERQPDPGTSASGTSDSDVLARALRWRERAVADGVPGAGDLKPGRVRSLVSRGLRSAEEIATGLPETLAHLAPDLAAAMEGEAGSRAASPGHDGAPLADAAASTPQPGPRPRDGTGPGPDDRPGTASGTAADPAPDPVPSPDPDAGPAVDERLKGLTFARFRYQEVPPPAGEVLVEENDVTGGVVLSWPDAVIDDSDEHPTVVIYRVVSDDHAAALLPERRRLRAHRRDLCPHGHRRPPLRARGAPLRRVAPRGCDRGGGGGGPAGAARRGLPRRPPAGRRGPLRPPACRRGMARPRRNRTHPGHPDPAPAGPLRPPRAALGRLRAVRRGLQGHPAGPGRGLPVLGVGRRGDRRRRRDVPADPVPGADTGPARAGPGPDRSASTTSSTRTAATRRSICRGPNRRTAGCTSTAPTSHPRTGSSVTRWACPPCRATRPACRSRPGCATHRATRDDARRWRTCPGPPTPTAPTSRR